MRYLGEQDWWQIQKETSKWHSGKLSYESCYSGRHQYRSNIQTSHYLQGNSVNYSSKALFDKNCENRDLEFRLPLYRK